MPSWVPTQRGPSELTLPSLFVTIAFILMDAKFSDLIPPRLLARVRNAMYIATKGDEQRVAGVNGDNLRPCYTNVGLLPPRRMFSRR